MHLRGRAGHKRESDAAAPMFRARSDVAISREQPLHRTEPKDDHKKAGVISNEVSIIAGIASSTKKEYPER